MTPRHDADLLAQLAEFRAELDDYLRNCAEDARMVAEWERMA